MTANERLKKIIDDEGRKYNWVAKQTGLPMSTVSDILNGKRTLDAELIVLFCNLLKCPASEIVPTKYDQDSA